jgi:acyl-CoA-binding protein
MEEEQISTLVGCFRRVRKRLAAWFGFGDDEDRYQAALHKKDDDRPRTFEEAVSDARHLKLGNAERLQLYALYKQATVGDAPETMAEYSAGRFDPAAAYKWRSWAKLRNMTAADARERYVLAVSGDAGAGSDDASDGGDEALDELDEAMSGMAGPVQSSLSMSAEDVEAIAQADLRQPLHAAARRGDADAIGRLVSAGASVNAADEDQHTALHWACDGGYEEAASALIDRGASIDVQNCDGSTPLHMACVCEHLAVAQLLLNAGATSSIRDDDGCTPAEHAPASMAEALGVALAPPPPVMPEPPAPLEAHTA